MKKVKVHTTESGEAVAKRLDALIRVNLEGLRSDKKRKLTIPNAARILKSVGLSPTEIARILGKKSATDVAPYLYSKRRQQKR